MNQRYDKEKGKEATYQKLEYKAVVLKCMVISMRLHSYDAKEENGERNGNLESPRRIRKSNLHLCNVSPPAALGTSDDVDRKRRWNVLSDRNF
jgi:hypothetical protein